MSVRSRTQLVLVALLVTGVLVVTGFALTAQAAPANQAATAVPTGTAMPTTTVESMATEVPTTTLESTATVVPMETVTSTTTTTTTAALAPAFNAATFNPARTITVVGRGEVRVKPEVANTTIGVDIQAGTVDEAMAEAQARMTAILEALKGLGIAEKDIQTSNFSINFERSTSGEATSTTQSEPGEFQPVPGFYRVSNMVQVTIRDLTKVTDVLDTAVKSGANNIWGISFGLDDTKSLEVQAREAAVQDARARAESLAELNGVKAGGVVSISEVIGSQAGLTFAAAEGRGGGGGTPVQPGEVTFSTQIQVVYAIE